LLAKACAHWRSLMMLIARKQKPGFFEPGFLYGAPGTRFLLLL